MKKLMIAAAIVCAAAMSQAATCYWNLKTADVEGTIYNMAGTEKFNGTAYLFLGDGQEDVLAAVRNKEGITGYETTAVVADGKFKIEGYTTETAAAKQAWYLVLQDGDNLLISDSVNKNVQTGAQGRDVPFALEWTSFDKDAKFDFDTDFATGAEGWYATAAVPEPTSGLLLLLGVAGLALRRRRA